MAAAHPSALDAAASAARDPWGRADPADESVGDKHGTAPAPPVARLYRDALESVFEFLDLANLSRVLTVSRSWTTAVDAVRSLKCVGAAVPSKRACSWMIAASPLASHVRHVGSKSVPLVASSGDLFILSRPPISLVSLACAVDLSPPSRLFLGASLQSLKLDLYPTADNTSAINDAIVTVSRLPALAEFEIRLQAFFPEVSFAPLAVAHQLQVFKSRQLTVGARLGLSCSNCVCCLASARWT